MASKVTISVKTSGLQAALARKIKPIERRIDNRANDVADVVADEMRYYAPVDTGFLKRNIIKQKRQKNLYFIKSLAFYSELVVGKRYARGPFRGQIIDYIKRAVAKGRLYKKALIR